jgi:hypothetical protein
MIVWYFIFLMCLSKQWENDISFLSFLPWIDDFLFIHKSNFLSIHKHVCIMLIECFYIQSLKRYNVQISYNKTSKKFKKRKIEISQNPRGKSWLCRVDSFESVRINRVTQNHLKSTRKFGNERNKSSSVTLVAHKLLVNKSFINLQLLFMILFTMKNWIYRFKIPFSIWKMYI